MNLTFRDDNMLNNVTCTFNYTITLLFSACKTSKCLTFFLNNCNFFGDHFNSLRTTACKAYYVHAANTHTCMAMSKTKKLRPKMDRFVAGQ